MPKPPEYAPKVPTPGLPLNGTKTRPLTEASLTVLRSLAREPEPRSRINPGVSNRLLREALAETVQLRSPFATHRGKHIEHLRITEAGRAVLQPCRPPDAP